MQIISDLHIHSRFSRATSKSLDLKNLEKYARIKGISLLGTGDFTHPGWIKELKQELSEDGTGILRTKTGFYFILQTEISSIYTQGKGRKVHNIILAPNFDTAEKITDYFKSKGRVDYDGRPIFKIPCYDLVYNLRKIDEKIEVIPAHVWTPHFGVLGSVSGFDSIEEAYKDQSKHIHALETGLSSDPEMNWRLSKLDRYTLVSNSDAHSFWPWRLGREANIFDLKTLSYDSIINALKNKEIKSTIEVDPGYGKYHFDGHRNCNVCMHPKDSIQSNDICPKCGRKMTIGVLHRVEELADRPQGYNPKEAVPFKRLIPLSDIIAFTTGSCVASKKVWATYYSLIKEFKDEFNILLDAPEDQIQKIVGDGLTKAIIDNRNENIAISPGFDGEYGKPTAGPITFNKPQKVQTTLSSF